MSWWISVNFQSNASFRIKIQHSCNIDNISHLCLIGIQFIGEEKDINKSVFDFQIGKYNTMNENCRDLVAPVQMSTNSLPSMWNVSSRNAMIPRYGMRGHGQKALQLSNKELSRTTTHSHPSKLPVAQDLLTNASSYWSALQTWKTKNKNVVPEMKHYTCVVDMLGQARLLEEAFEVIKKMQSDANNSILAAFL